jgi:hypothetical protein
MQSFRDFLQEQEQKLRAEEETENQRLVFWKRSVGELAAQITEWLQEDDPLNLVKIDRRSVRAGNGPAQAQRLTSLIIRVGSRSVEFLPLSGPLMGPMTRPKRTN